MLIKSCLRTALVACFCCIFLATTGAQSIQIRAIDGKSGKPMAAQRLLLWTFEAPQDRASPGKFDQADLQTDGNGWATIPDSILRWSHLQVWVDFHTRCLKNSTNFESLSLEEIRLHGLVSENTCGKGLRVTAGPSQLVVFARKPTLKERMAW